MVARAYLDQLSRSSAVSPQQISAMSAAIAKAEASRSRKDAAHLKTLAASLDKDAASAKTPADAQRMRALAAILNEGGNPLR